MSNFVEWSDIDVNFKKRPDGEISIVRGEDAINQSIKLMLSTMRWERVRSDLHSSLYRVLFEPMTQESADEIRSIIETMITRWENRITQLSVRVEPFFEQNFYKIHIGYSLLPTRARKNLTTYVPALGEN